MSELPTKEDKVCNCDMRTRLVGDGCSACNPKLWEELVSPECERCGTVLAFEGDECGLCEEDDSQ
jgi:hypothetical protein